MREIATLRCVRQSNSTRNDLSIYRMGDMSQLELHILQDAILRKLDLTDGLSQIHEMVGTGMLPVILKAFS